MKESVLRFEGKKPPWFIHFPIAGKY